MSVNILSNNFEVHFRNDSGGGGDKQITWIGSSTGTNTVNELYSALQDLFDNTTASVGDYMNEGVPMSAATPTSYTIGEVETNDNEPWFIDDETIKHLTGGALSTTGWTRSPLTGDGTGTIGIVRVPRSGSNIVSGDVGNTITHADGDSGKLLYVETNYLWIRPDDNTAANSFDNATTQNITCNTHTDSQTGAATSGERVWSNPYTIGNIVDNTRIYIYQSFDEITNFWGDGHIDRLILTDDDFASGLIDLGNLTFFARQYGTLYDFAIANFDAGGRAPVALSASDDVNNDTGPKSMSISGASGSYTVGEVISNGSTASGVVTAETGDPTTTLYYYLIGDLTDFSASQTITGATSGVTGTSGTPANNGPANLTTNPTITFGATSKDISDGFGSQPYDVLINVQGNTLENMYEYLKYITRRQTGSGGTNDIDGGTQTVEGESYIATADLFIPYDTASTNPTVPFTEGETVSDGVTFTGVITAVHSTGADTGFLAVRDTRGDTPADNATLTGVTSTHTVLVDTTTNSIETYTQLRVSPFGTFAGGNFFGARGVWIENMDSNDANDYQLIDSYGVTHSPPATVPITITVVDKNNQPIQTAQTAVYQTSDNTELLNTDTNASGIASTSIVYSTDIDVYIRVRKSSTGDTKYIPNSTTGTVTSTGLAVTMVMRLDNNA